MALHFFCLVHNHKKILIVLPAFLRRRPFWTRAHGIGIPCTHGLFFSHGLMAFSKGNWQRFGPCSAVAVVENITVAFLLHFMTSFVVSMAVGLAFILQKYTQELRLKGGSY